MSNRSSGFIKALGPGILFASTAIGVSHLVQSTRAGAKFGFGLMAIVLLTNLFKYPFFEYGSRYANATGTSIIDGYKRYGNWMIWLYLFITIGSMFFVCAAVGFVTAGFMDNLFGINNLLQHAMGATFCVFVVCLGILMTGKYNVLDTLVKIIGATLLVSTIWAFLLTLTAGPTPRAENFVLPEVWQLSNLPFIIALMGWMPCALDLSAWNSLWTLARINQTGYHPTLKETLFDFNFGYIISVILAVCFITMGAFIMFGTNETLPEGSASFANSIVELYTKTIGNWSYYIIAPAAFSIMFGTAIAVFDGYARSLERSIQLIRDQESTSEITSKNSYKYALLVVAVGAYMLIYYFHDKPKGFKALVDLATTISFLIAPIIAVVNFRLVGEKYIDESKTPSSWLHILSWMGIIFLSGFSVIYIGYKMHLFDAPLG